MLIVVLLTAFMLRPHRKWCICLIVGWNFLFHIYSWRPWESRNK